MMVVSTKKHWLVLWMIAGIPLRASAGPGDVEITPSLQIGSGYHRNVYFLSGGIYPSSGAVFGTPYSSRHQRSVYRTDTPPEEVIGAPFWLIHPEMALVVEQPWVHLDMRGGYGLWAYINTRANDGLDMSSMNQYNNADLKADVQILPSQVLGFKVSELLDVQNMPADLQKNNITAQNVSSQTENVLEGGLVIRPSTAVDVNLLGTFAVDLYHLAETDFSAYPEVLEVPDNTLFNRRIDVGPMASAVWRLRPDTALMAEASVNWNHWQNNLIPALVGGPDAGVGEVLAKPDSRSWRTIVGLRRAFNDHIGAEVEVGYGQMYYDEASVRDYNSSLENGLSATSYDLALFGVKENADNYARDLTSIPESIILQAQTTWTPVQDQRLTLAYHKDFQDVIFRIIQPFILVH